MARLSYAKVIESMNNAYGMSSDYVNAKADFRKQQIIKESIHFSQKSKSTPDKHLLSDIDLPCSSLSNVSGVVPICSSNNDVSDEHNSVEDDFEDEHDDNVGLVANVNNNNLNNPRPVPVLGRGAKSSRKRKTSLINKHRLINCVCKCKYKCQLFDEETRTNIHAKYWDMSYEKQQMWLCGQTSSKHPERIRIRSDIRQKERKNSNTYLLSINGEDMQVCQKFFLSTLGYSGNSVLRSMFAKMAPTKMTPPISKRGKHSPNTNYKKKPSIPS